MLSILFSEVAGWLFVYIKEAVSCIGEDATKKLLQEVLKLPRFVLAREYYLTHLQENAHWAELLRKADVDEYILRAKEEQKKRNIKATIKNVLKKIYMSI